MVDRSDEFQALLRIARVTHVDAQVLYEWVRQEIVVPTPGGWDEEAIEAVQRARRLSELGVNAEGIEVVLHMRQEMVRLRSEIAALERSLADIERRHQVELARLLRELVANADWSR